MTTKKEFLKNKISNVSEFETFELEAKIEHGSYKKVFRRIKFKGNKILFFEDEGSSGSWWGWTIYLTDKKKFVVFEEEFTGGYVSKYETFINVFSNIEDLIEYMEKYYQLSFNSELYKRGYYEEV